MQLEEASLETAGLQVLLFAVFTLGSAVENGPAVENSIILAPPRGIWKTQPTHELSQLKHYLK